MRQITFKKSIIFLIVVLTISVGATFMFNAKVDKVIKAARTYTGVRYQIGGMDRKGIDCSALMLRSFSAVGYTLPRVSWMQATVGKPVPLDKLQLGDLVFFGHLNSTKVSHVGMVTVINSKTDIKFINATCSKGVMESNLYSNYWKSRLLKARRVPLGGPEVKNEDNNNDDDNTSDVIVRNDTDDNTTNTGNNVVVTNNTSNNNSNSGSNNNSNIKTKFNNVIKGNKNKDNNTKVKNDNTKKDHKVKVNLNIGQNKNKSDSDNKNKTKNDDNKKPNKVTNIIKGNKSNNNSKGKSNTNTTKKEKVVKEKDDDKKVKINKGNKEVKDVKKEIKKDNNNTNYTSNTNNNTNTTSDNNNTVVNNNTSTTVKNSDDDDDVTINKNTTTKKSTNPLFDKVEFGPVFFGADNVVKKAKSFIGTKFKKGGMDESGIDVIGLLSQAFSKVDAFLPDNYEDFKTMGVKADLDYVEMGDVLLFVAEPGKKEVIHAGMISEIKGNTLKGYTIKFIHVLPGKGVIETIINDKYWRDRVLGVRRLY